MASTQFVHVIYKQIPALVAMYSNVLVYFDASWEPSFATTRFAAAKSTTLLTLFYCDVKHDVDAENFVIDVMKLSTFPILVCFKTSVMDFIPICGLSNIASYLRSSPWGNQYRENATLDNVKILFEAGIGRVFISGDKSSVGKSTTCLCLLSSLIRLGFSHESIAYIKPVTQCEAEQPITRFCSRVGIENRSIGPIVFYKGFTRAFLNGETDSSSVLLQKAQFAVDEVSLDKKFVLIDGVGYPSVGSICGLSNAAVAKAINSPVLLVGKSGVGDAVDSYNLNSSYFESQGIPVLGGIFNKLELEGFYGLESCKSAISSYFRQFRHEHVAYGFMPKIDVLQAPTSEEGESGFITLNEYRFLQSEIDLSDNFLKYVDVYKLLTDIWRKNLFLQSVSFDKFCHQRSRHVVAQYFNNLNRKVEDPIINSEANMEICDSAPVHLTASRVATSPILKTIESNNVPVTKKRSREEVESEAFGCGAKMGG